jgi:hypothetical protein
MRLGAIIQRRIIWRMEQLENALFDDDGDHCKMTLPSIVMVALTRTPTTRASCLVPSTPLL